MFSKVVTEACDDRLGGGCSSTASCTVPVPEQKPNEHRTEIFQK